MTDVWVRLRVGAEHYALDVEAVREVVDLDRPVTPVPGAPPAIAGVINVHGQVVPVVAVASVLGAPATAAGEARRVVIVHDGARRAGLAVDDVIDVAPAAAPIEPSSSTLLLGAVLVDGALVGVIDLDALLGAAG